MIDAVDESIHTAIEFFRRGDSGLALEVLRSECGKNPSNAMAWLMLGQILVRVGKLNEALCPLRRAVRLTPLEAAGYWELGAAYRIAGDGLLTRECEMTAKILETTEDRSSELAALIARGDYDSALDHGKRLILENSADIRIRFQLSLIYQTFNDYESVIDCLSPVATALPACAMVHKGLADFIWSATRLKEMSAQFAAILQGEIERNGSFNTGTAEWHYRAAIRHDPDWSEARTYFANFLDETGNKDEALEHYRIAARFAPENALVRLNLALALERQGQTAAAQQEAEAASHLDPALGEAQECLGRLASASDPISAAHHFDLALRRQRFHTTAANL
jgi:tetratricopeptide (TPR) repeat protein